MLIIMAKIIIQNAEELHTIARQLAQAGITLDTRQLPDNSYRIYIRKKNMQAFLAFINRLNNKPPN